VQSMGWWCFVRQSLSPERFVAAAEAGFAGLELVPPEHRGPVRDHGLAISSIASHQPLEIGLNRRDQHEHRTGNPCRDRLAAGQTGTFFAFPKLKDANE